MIEFENLSKTTWEGQAKPTKQWEVIEVAIKFLPYFMVFQIVNIPGFTADSSELKNVCSLRIERTPVVWI